MKTIIYFEDEVFYPVRTGFHRVAYNHWAYLRERRLSARLVLYVMPYDENRLDAFEWEYRDINRRIVCIGTEDPAAFRDFCRYRTPWTFDNIRRSYEVLGQSTVLRNELGSADVFFTSYAFRAPLAGLLPSGCVGVNETVDLQARQFASMAGSERVDEGVLAQELECYRRFQHLVMVNPVETRFLQERLPGVRVTYVPQFLEVEPCPVDCSGADYDIVYLSSSHTSNVISVQEFYFNCYLPYLKHAGVRFALAGSVCDAFEIGDATVAKLGRVPDVRDVYCNAQMVVCPITRGAGVSIKTLEALSYGKPIVATHKALAGLSVDEKALLITDDWREFAEHVLRLKASAKALAREAQISRDVVAASHTRERYMAAMDDVFSAIL